MSAPVNRCAGLFDRPTVSVLKDEEACPACGHKGRFHYRDRLAKRGAAVQVAREAVVNKVREWADSVVELDGMCAEERAVMKAVRELDRQEAKLKEEGR